jgi:hypothetical protein
MTLNDPSKALGSGNYAISAFFAAVHESGIDAVDGSSTGT